jgi:hypothetical protein
MKKNTPNFLVVGVMKGSTSAAAHNLDKHDDVFCLTPYWKEKVNTFYGYNTDDFVGGLAQESSKETDFFSLQDNFNLGRDIYESYFPQSKIAIGEASPNYFYLGEAAYPKTIENIGLTLGAPKIIILLRDPITRSFSHWNHIQRPTANFGARFKSKTFNECTEQTSGVRAKNSILNRSKYVDNIVKFRQAFGVENVYVGIQEEIKANPAEEYNKIFNFLGVNDLPLDTTYNAIHEASYDTTIDESTKTWLKSYFKSDVDTLKALYPDLDYSKWNTY